MTDQEIVYLSLPVDHDCGKYSKEEEKISYQWGKKILNFLFFPVIKLTKYFVHSVRHKPGAPFNNYMW